MSARTRELADLGVSIWLDDLSRDRIVSGGLATLIAQDDVVGITTNPTIFANALAGTDSYDTQLGELAATGVTAEEAAFELTTHDVAAAADILLPVYTRTAGDDGWVSIEVGASVAHDADATIEEARRLAAKVSRPNVFVKIPATTSGLSAITASIASGISVNVTLILGLDRYRAVVDAYLEGLELALAAGRDLSDIRSVASLFVSRVDTAVDAELERIGTPAALDLRGRAGVANARLAYEIFQTAFAGDRARRLRAAGAHAQRPLWASTGVKDPRLPDTHYVVELVAEGVVNTMPEKTLRAVSDHARLRGDTISGSFDESRRVLEDLAGVGIRLDEVTGALERDGIEKFARSGEDLLATVDAALGRLR